MLLGGLRYLLPVIEVAHQLGIYVITVDYLPDNIAHKYSDEYHNISIIDKDAVLQLASELDIDGIMSFAVDPGVVTASYVQERMHLPSFGPYESVYILQHKDLFRKFLAENGFNVPVAKGFDSVESAIADTTWIPLPCIVKPTDSAGSKGVTRVNSIEKLRGAVEWAMNNSLSHHIIIEEFIEKDGCSSDSDAFSLNGKLIVCSFNAQYFDESAAGPYVPAAFSWPSTFTKEQEAQLQMELQRLLSLLHMNTSIYNVETRIGTNGKPYIMEVSPRGGGNRLAEMLRYSTGTDIIKACVQASVGIPVGPVHQLPLNGYWSEVVLHSEKDGVFQSIEISPEFAKHHLTSDGVDLWVRSGDSVHAFRGANDSIGTLVLKFCTQAEMENALVNQHDWLNVNVE